jgi:hypothetical protein
MAESDSLKAGALVHNPTFGVTMLAKDGARQSFDLVNLSQSGNEPKKFAKFVAPVPVQWKTVQVVPTHR